MEGKFNIDGLKGIFSSQPTGIPDRKMGNARGTRHQHPRIPQQINPCS